MCSAGDGGAPAGAVYRRVASVRSRAGQPEVLVVEVRVGFGPGSDVGVSRGVAPHEIVVVALLFAPEEP